MSTVDPEPRLARGPAIVTVLVSGGLLLVVATLLVPWDWVPAGTLDPARASEIFSQAEIDRAEEYSRIQRLLSLASYAVSLLVALVLGMTPLGARLVRRVTPDRWWVAVPLAAAALLLVGRLVTLPLSVAVQNVQRAYGLSNQPWTAWAADVAKSYGVSVVVTSLILLVIVGCARRSPRWWFAWAGSLGAGLVVAGSFLYPVLVEPLFNDFRPMPEGAFRATVFELAETEDVAIQDVLVADASRRTTTVNAYVSGFGGTRRVVIYDNLLTELSEPQARVVIAHELAHAKHADVLVGTLLGALGILAGISLLALLLDSRRLLDRSGARGPGDPAVVALILALSAVGTFVTSPAVNAVSRAVEARADRDSITATGNGEEFVGMQHELALHALHDPTPPWLMQFWFGSHPTVLERVGIARAMEAAE